MGKAVRYRESEINYIPEKTFKDRDEERRLFWNTYDAMQPEEAYVINYYGFGGIGKSALCNFLYEKYDSQYKKEIKSKSFVLNFETIKNNCDKVEILKHLANRFESKCGYNLTYFNYALYVYYRALGKTNDAPEMRALKDNPVFDSVLDVISFVPVVGEIGSALIKNVDTLVAGVKELMISHKDEIINLDKLSAEDIADRLINFFVDSIYDALLKEKRPIVIFLDTYEQFQNYIHRIDSAKISEEFLWAQNGLIRQLPNVLWIVAGFKKLSWAEDSDRKYDDPYWCNIENISYKEISEIDEKYVKEMFHDLNIYDTELIDFIVRKTKGVPEHIRMCIDRYFNLKNKGRVPTIEDFEVDYKTLASRYIGGLGDDDKDLIEILACLEKWNAEDITRLGKSHNRFENLAKLSFIRKDEDMYFMQESVRKIVSREANTQNRKISIKYLNDRIEDESIVEVVRKDYYLVKIKLQLLEICLEKNEEESLKKIASFFEENIKFICKSVYDDFLFEIIKQYIGEYISEELIPAPYNSMLKVYQLYRYNLIGDFEQAKDYILATDIEKYKDEMENETKAILYIALAECMADTEKWNDYYLEALDLCLNLDNDYARIELITGYAESLYCHSNNEDAYEYTVVGLKELERMREDSLWVGYKCELLAQQAKIHLEQKNMDEALLKYAIAENLINEYQDNLSEKAMLVAGDIFVRLGQILIDENVASQYVEKAVSYTEKLFKKQQNRRNRYNVANAYRVIAESSLMEKEKQAEYYDKAIKIFEELYSIQKSQSYLDGWFLTAKRSFENGIEEEKNIEMCKTLSQREDIYNVNALFVFDFCKSLVIYHMNKAEYEELEYAMMILTDLDYKVDYLYVNDEKKYLIEKMWIYEKIGDISNIYGDHEGAYEKWYEVNKISSVLFANSRELRFLNTYKNSCRWLRDLCMEGFASVCTLENALQYSLEETKASKLFLDIFNDYNCIVEYIKGLNSLGNIYTAMNDSANAEKVAAEEMMYRNRLLEYK